ncbi:PLASMODESMATA CALLOSE-BINDING PROTEIN 1-like [Hordeum vulgare subsp. vulgare]|uniref:Uncharacterized protein n=1 Tax=Hordeum vulgare subsp. vulgare TaxID=112509 RepID=M0XV15_HORVV|nr:PLASMODESMATA CALLOSE-BINDING PROTEIN 1-like [Hordeum vulgare subsp. vulgare]
MARFLRPSNCIGAYLLVLLAFCCCGTEQRRVEASNRLTQHPRILTTVSVMKPSYPTITTPTSASYAMPAYTPMTPSSRFPSLADDNGGGDIGGGGIGGGGATGGGGTAGGAAGGATGGGGTAGGATGGGGTAGGAAGGATGGGGTAGGGVGGGGAAGGGGGGGTWCVASQSASTSALQVALDYACGYSGVDCSAIQTGGSCFSPDTIHDHASYAFNSYYQKNPLPTSCDFGGTATITTTDPSSGSCQYPASSGGAQGMMPPPSPTALTPTTPMTPTPMTPMTPTPMTPDTPSTGTPMYGSSSPPDFGSMSPPGGLGSNSPPDYSDVGAAPATAMGRATLAIVIILAATLSMSLAT